MFPISDYFDINSFAHASLFDGNGPAWEALKRIKEYLKANLVPGIHGTVMEGAWVGDDVYIGEGTVVEPGCYIKGPTIIGKNCEIRHTAYIRGTCILGDGCVVGHTTEMKGSVLLDGAKAPHFAYIGDSLLGNECNLGAGTKISNFKITRDEVIVSGPSGRTPSGLRKFGAVIGDRVQIGCNTVLNPGTMIGHDCLVYALASVRGTVPPHSVVKLVQTQAVRPSAPRA